MTRDTEVTGLKRVARGAGVKGGLWAKGGEEEEEEKEKQW